MKTFELYALYDKTKWFRVEDREKTSYPAKKFTIGQIVDFTQKVVRAGYYWQPEDMPENELEKLAMDLLVLQSTYNLQAFEAGKPNPSQRSESLLSNIKPVDMDSINSKALKYKERGIITPEIVMAICEAVDIFPQRFWRHLNYKVRGKWVKHMRNTDKEHDCTLRTLYYQENPIRGYSLSDHTATGRIVGKITRIIGRYYPPSSSGEPWYGDDYEFEPGGIEAPIRQTLLKLEDTNFGMVSYVHPLDAIVRVVDGGCNG